MGRQGRNREERERGHSVLNLKSVLHRPPAKLHTAQSHPNNSSDESLFLKCLSLCFDLFDL